MKRQHQPPPRQQFSGNVNGNIANGNRNAEFLTNMQRPLNDVSFSRSYPHHHQDSLMSTNNHSSRSYQNDDDEKGEEDHHQKEKSHSYNDKQRIREEMERERRIRMAKLRAESLYDDQTTQPHISDIASGNSDDRIVQSASDSKISKKRKNSQDVVKDFNVDDDDDDDVNNNDETARMMQQMFGITNFGSTKNTKVETNHTSAAIGTVSKHKARKYRQYMNRKNGFNRPLDNV